MVAWGRRRGEVREKNYKDCVEHVTILLLVVVSWMYTYIKTSKLYTLNVYNCVYVNYTLIKLLRKELIFDSGQIAETRI